MKSDDQLAKILGPIHREGADGERTTIAPRDRVNEALAFRRPDRTPRDFAAVPEIRDRLAHILARRTATRSSAALAWTAASCRTTPSAVHPT